MVDFSVCPRHSIVHCVTQVTDYPPPFYKPFTIWSCQYMSSLFSNVMYAAMLYYQPLWPMEKLKNPNKIPEDPKFFRDSLTPKKLSARHPPHALNLRPPQDSQESTACPWRGRLQILTIAQSFDVTYFQCSACFYRVRSGSGSISRAISPCISPSTVQVYNCTCISLGALNTALFFFRTSSVSPQRMPSAVFFLHCTRLPLHCPVLPHYCISPCPVLPLALLESQGPWYAWPPSIIIIFTRPSKDHWLVISPGNSRQTLQDIS